MGVLVSLRLEASNILQPKVSKVVKGVKGGYELPYLNAKNQTLVFFKGNAGKRKKSLQ